MYKIYNVDDNYEYQHEYSDIEVAKADILKYEKEDIKAGKVIDNYVIINNETGEQVHNSLDEAEKILIESLSK